MYILVFRGNDQGVVLLKYTIQENEYTFMKRSTKLTMFIQIMLFSMDGIYTLFIDRRQELMIFATGLYIARREPRKNETDNSLKWRINWSQRGAGVSALVTLMLGCRTIHCYYCIRCSCVSIFWYVVLQKRLVRDCKTIVARDQRGDYVRIIPMQLGVKHCTTTRFTRSNFWTLVPAISVHFSISGRRKRKKSGVRDCCWNYIYIDEYL